MRRYDLLPAAHNDLLDLAEHAASYSDRSRDALTDTLVECFDTLSTFLEMGRQREDLAPQIRSFALRSLRATVYYIVSGPEPDRILIARLLRQRREARPSDFR